MAADHPSRAAVEQLRDELRLTRAALDRIAAECAAVGARHADVPPDTVTLYGAGALLHGYYTAIERFLQVVARDFNSEPPQGPDWHRRLLVAAASERPGRRPPVIRPGTATVLDRYVRFRHLFRNLYVFQLDWAELRPLIDGLSAVHGLAGADLSAFDDFLRALF